MKRFVPASFCFFLSSLFCIPPVLADLKHDIDLILSDKSLVKASFGVEIVQLGETAKANHLLFERNKELPLIPASNMKLITTSAALDRLGPDFKFKTRLVLHDGNLILIGDGDPSFGDAELLTRVGWDVTTVFAHWAQQVKLLNAGTIKSVIVDDSIFDEQAVHPNWPADQRLDWYEAEVAGMNLNMNCLDAYIRPAAAGNLVTCLTNPPTHFVKIDNQCTTGDGTPWLNHPENSNEMTLRGKASVANDVPIQITIHDGPMYAATVLYETLVGAGISCAPEVRRDRTMNAQMQKALAAGDSSWQLLAVHETPLPQVLNRSNKDSKNLYAECLCKRLGFESAGQPGSWKNGGKRRPRSSRKSTCRRPNSSSMMAAGCRKRI